MNRYKLVKEYFIAGVGDMNFTAWIYQFWWDAMRGFSFL